MRRAALIALLVFGITAAPAHAHAPTLGELSETLTTEHFQVHFTGDIGFDGGGHATIRQYVGEFAATAEWAYETYRSWGYPAHVPDGDGLIDVYVYDFGHAHGATAADVVAFATPLGGAAQAPGSISVNVESIRDSQAAAHQAFHMLQMALYARAPDWFAQATAAWAAFRLREYSTVAVGSAPPFPPAADNSLDCTPAASPAWPDRWVQRPCGLTGYEAAGFTRWTFFQYLGERFGADVVREVWSRMQSVAGPAYDGDDAVRDVLVTKGTTLADVFNDYSVAVLAGEFQAASLKEQRPTTYKSAQTPDTTKALTRLEVAVNRLASRYVELKPPPGGEGPCYAATLTLNVAIPAGTSAKPYLYFPETKVKTPLAVNGANATVTTAWDTCSSQSPAILSLPNASQTLDARLFFVTGSVTVDTSKVVSGKAPPLGVTVTGQIIAAPTEEPVPTLFLYAPSVLRVLGTARTIGFAVYSSGAGKLSASFAGARLPDVRLRAGANRVVLRLPKPAARLAFASRPVLQLTPFSTAGQKGATIVQKVAFTKAKPKRKRP